MDRLSVWGATYMPLNSDLFTKEKAVRDRLNLALTYDSQHVTPGQKGVHQDPG